MNKLWYGDNLTIMQGMKKHSVDLIYLDPPFKSDANYNLIYKNMTGRPVPEQAEAFFDTWELDAAKLDVARKMPVLMREYGVDDNYVEFWRIWMQALRNTQPELLAYLIYMTQRLLHMKSLLRTTGSIYLHCDPAASHYIKVMMDGIFGHENFRNEVIWKRTSAHSGAKRYGPVHDTILFYSAGPKFTWNTVYGAYDPQYVEAFFTHQDEKGRRWRRTDLTGPGTRAGDSGKSWRHYDPSERGRHWQPPSYFYEKYKSLTGDDLARYDLIERLDKLDECGLIHWPQKVGGAPQGKRLLEDAPGVPLQDVWTDIKPIHNIASERLGYPTQKPIALLDRIILSSSNKGDVVFDPFCGCGTTVYSSIRNERQWIGCDIAILAIKLIREELTERHRLVEGVHFEVDGIPVSVEQAEELFRRDPFQFQHWAVERLGGFPMQKKVADRGIDGRMYFETKSELGEMILSVKGGKLRPTDIRDLRGVIEREGAQMGGFISLQEPSKAMRTEAAEAGMYEYGGNTFQRLQLLTIRDVIEQKREFHMPTRIGTKISTGQQSLPL
ncbi:DNA methyltransferase [Amaricoccus sp. W119]|uniref:DNA methyltransferase n=1 Tax=Amaricoccus sp. W119 TaxID=3391833 RepID=UPI0039A5C004